MIADFMTVKENFGRLEGITLVYVGDGRNNMANSLLVTGAILGVNVRICAQKNCSLLMKSLITQKNLRKNLVQN